MMNKQAELKKQAYASDLKSRALSILIYLIDRSNQDLTCFPAISTMAEQLHISVSTVKRALHELVSGGFIKKNARQRKDSRGQTSNLYTIVMQENAPETQKTKKSIEPADAVLIEEAPAQKGDQKTDCNVTYITFEALKAEQKNCEEIKAVCEPMASQSSMAAVANENKLACKPVAAFVPKRVQEQDMREQSIIEKIFSAFTPVRNNHTSVFPITKRESKACKLVRFSWNRALLFVCYWTGVGFSLRPP